MEYEGLLILHTVKAVLFAVWFYVCLYCVYHFNNSQLMSFNGKEYTNILALLFGPFVVFGVYVVQVSVRAYKSSTSFGELIREVFRGDVWKRKSMSKGANKDAEIRLIDNSGRSFEQIYSASSDRDMSGVVRLSKTIIWEALEDNASDILIDPETSESFSVRFRIDGKLQKVRELPGDVAGAVVNSIKALSSMDISEKRRPQDGAFSAKFDQGSASFRVASAGVVNGEKLSIRVLNVFSKMLFLDDLGLSGRDHKLLKDAISKQSGMIIVCGPTGSGKTTSLYAMLSEMNYSERNIITVEDPVEYQMAGISQIEINSKAGITFANTLRGVLRQDPDVITIGEIRDQETAQIAIQASHTGHLVIGTMHSGDNLTALLRLMDLGIKPVMLADALSLVISQRLVRKLCESCKRVAKLPADKEQILRKKGIDISKVMTAVGCEKCRNTGYSGRIAVFDVLKIDQEIKNDVFCLENVSAEQMRRIAGEKIKSRLHKEAMKVVLMGLTSYTEVKSIQ